MLTVQSNRLLELVGHGLLGEGEVAALGIARVGPAIASEGETLLRGVEVRDQR